MLVTSRVKRVHDIVRGSKFKTVIMVMMGEVGTTQGLRNPEIVHVPGAALSKEFVQGCAHPPY